jgi:hypothetical protein
VLVLVSSAAPLMAQVVQLDAKGFQNVQNLSQIALAMENYDAANNTFPGQYLQSGGSPVLSWRVALLPYLGYQQLYNAFDKTKPWDDAANLPLLQQMPDVFRSPADAAGVTTSRYLVGAGANMIFNGATGSTFNSITDGASNTLLLGESAAGVPWTQPQDIPVPNLSGANFGSITPGYVPFAFADGSVNFLSTGIDSTTLLHLFQKNDGAAIDPAVKHSFAVVPEPGGLALVGLGLLALTERRRRRKT